MFRRPANAPDTFPVGSPDPPWPNVPMPLKPPRDEEEDEEEEEEEEGTDERGRDEEAGEEAIPSFSSAVSPFCSAQNCSSSAGVAPGVEDVVDVVDVVARSTDRLLTGVPPSLTPPGVALPFVASVATPGMPPKSPPDGMERLWAMIRLLGLSAVSAGTELRSRTTPLGPTDRALIAALLA